MQTPALDNAPGKSLLPKIREGDVQALDAFIEERVKWGGGILIHDRFVTYSIFSDLEATLGDREITTRLVGHLMASLEGIVADEEFIAAIFLINHLRGSLQLDVLDDCETQIASLLAAEDRANSLKEKDGNISFWFYQIRNFLFFERIRLTTFDSFSRDQEYSEEAYQTLSASFRGALEFEGRVAYKGKRYWIWRGKRSESDPPSTPLYFRAIEEDSIGDIKCYGYLAPPEFSIPTEAIVKRIEATEFKLGNLHLIPRNEEA